MQAPSGIPVKARSGAQVSAGLLYGPISPELGGQGGDQQQPSGKAQNLGLPILEQGTSPSQSLEGKSRSGRQVQGLKGTSSPEARAGPLGEKEGMGIPPFKTQASHDERQGGLGN